MSTVDGENCSQRYCRVKPSLVKRERVYTCRVKTEADSREIRSATLSFSLFLPPPSFSPPSSLSVSISGKTRSNRSIYLAAQTCGVPKKERRIPCRGTWNATGCLSHAQSASIQASPLSTGLTSALSFPHARTQFLPITSHAPFAWCISCYVPLEPHPRTAPIKIAERDKVFLFSCCVLYIGCLSKKKK